MATTLVVSLAACGGQEKASDLPTLSPDSTTPPSSTPATGAPTTATPTVAPTRSTQKYGALTLILDHPNPVPKSEQVLEVYTEYERVSNKMLALNRDDPALANTAIRGALESARAYLADQKKIGVRTGGEITVTTKVARFSRFEAALDTCYDQSKSVLIRANGTSYVGPATKKFPRIKIRAVASRVGEGFWRVSEYEVLEQKC